MFGTYQRLGVHACASYRAVIRAASRKLQKRYRLSTKPDEKAARRAFYWAMLGHHANARRLYLQTLNGAYR